MSKSGVGNGRTNWAALSNEEVGAGAVRVMLAWVGEDPDREGLRETPRRVLGYLSELTEGYKQDPGEHLAVAFTEECDEMVVLGGIRFTSLCEHHLLPFTGTATVGYVPDRLVVGVSKLARVFEVFAHRLQLQERLTRQVAEAITHHLEPKGVGVVVRASHACLGCRGARQPDAELVTSSMTGVMRDKPEARAEFLALAYGRE
jgi:GTP cyclohydrolase I